MHDRYAILHISVAFWRVGGGGGGFYPDKIILKKKYFFVTLTLYKGMFVGKGNIDSYYSSKLK